MTKKPYNSQWRQVRRQVLNRDEYRCQVRGEHCQGIADEVDHLLPWREGGAKYDMANLRASCKRCNVGRANSRRNTLADMALRAKDIPPPSQLW